jgi:hypothetical protein
MQFSDGHDRGALDERLMRSLNLSASLSLTRAGPSPVASSSFPPFSCCHVSSLPSLSLIHMAFPPSHHPFTARHTSFSLHVNFPLKASPTSTLLSPCARSFCRVSSLQPSSPPMIQRHHSCHMPHSPRWPPCLSVIDILLFQVAA